MKVGSVRVSILLSQTEPNRTKISLRSKPRAGSDSTSLLVDVNALARTLGGGGHVRAAGVRLNVAIDEARTALIRAISELK